MAEITRSDSDRILLLERCFNTVFTEDPGSEPRLRREVPFRSLAAPCHPDSAWRNSVWENGMLYLPCIRNLQQSSGNSARQNRYEVQIAMHTFMKLPINIDDFSIIRENNFLYVDKTAQLESLIRNGDRYFLSRPAGFGKSLLLSTLTAMFCGKY